jgi:hypothetical protein
VNIKKETVLRTTAMFDEEERMCVVVASRTTLVVTRAMIEDVIGGTARIHLYGYRREGRKPTYAGWDYAGNEPKHVSYRLDDRIPSGARAVVAAMEVPR